MTNVKRLGNGYYELEFNERPVTPEIILSVENAFAQTAAVPKAEIIVNEARPSGRIRSVPFPNVAASPV